MKFSAPSIPRWLLYSLAALIILGSMGYSNYLATQLAKKEQESVQLYAEALEFFAGLGAVEEEANSLDDAITFISKVQQISGADNPQILLGEDNNINSYTLEMPGWIDSTEYEGYLEDKARSFSSQYAPIPVQFAPGRFLKVVYGESDLLRQLRWFPIIQLLVAFTFIGIVFGSYVIAKRNEQNKVWVGLAKETAHQLGTPVSSLMAWIELLKINLEESPEDQELVVEMEQDVLRLEDITERFSKIGSIPELSPVPLAEVLDRSANYARKRMTRSGRIRVHVQNQIPLDSYLNINPQLFDWVIENLLKNALDAMHSEGGDITIEAGEKGNTYYIDVSDTGKGIPKGNWNKVFTPGFTTKKRGWGLGLSLTKRIIENYHRGRIFVKHSEPGEGTTFRILLPKK